MGAVGEGVAAAKNAWGSGEAVEALAAGSDPFGVLVWEPYKAAQREIAQLSVAGVRNMRAASDDASRNQETTQTVVAVAVLLARAGRCDRYSDSGSASPGVLNRRLRG